MDFLGGITSKRISLVVEGIVSKVRDVGARNGLAGEITVLATIFCHSMLIVQMLFATFALKIRYEKEKSNRKFL